METRAAAKPVAPHSDALVILAVDEIGPGNEPARVYFTGLGADLQDGGRSRFSRWDPLKDALPLNERAGKHPVYAFIFPTKTYSEGLGGGGADISPEDRAMLRWAGRSAARLVCAKVSRDGGASSADQSSSQSLVAFDPATLARAPEIFKSCMTRPNRQDYMYLVTKTFGLNLVVRLAFASKAVMAGQLPLVRAVLSTSWYQLQDTVFTVFGQTYMKFLGRMTGMLRVGRAYLGDFAFVYVQLCGFEFLNRLVLGPLGENPLVYTWHGMTLIFLNILQGMISGGPLIPAINQARRAGVISHSTMMHLYQLTSLTMQFGLFATFGYQRFYMLLTTATLVLSWTSYAVFSLAFRDPEFAITEGDLHKTLSGFQG